MLKTVQIIAVIQGVFILLVLFHKRSKYKTPTFWLFVGSIISILLFIIGDDSNNLFQEGADWLLSDSTLFITFLLLFFKYYKTEKTHFNKKDLLFFLPNILYFIMESIELYQGEETMFVEAAEELIDFAFLGYLVYIIFDLFKNKSKYWILYLTIPIVLLMGFNYFNEVTELAEYKTIAVSESVQYQSYLLLIYAFLFYSMTYYLIIWPKELLPISKPTKYKGSKLNKEQVKNYKTALLDAMQRKALYKDPKLSIHKLSQELSIPRQYISEVLNIHFGKSFQDFVNEYRVEEFVKNLENDQYDHFTLFGLANEVGFNSKSTFNAIFKKHKGLTPSQFKKSLTQRL
ncbi:helix-turn-helix domain-containing protein [Croceitalea sp. MTPC9]|uniref:helix-turn-helix domain-containing protein n=1 Tax=unclassified Croceitalea TaxID=2632280 RepID=UPI002B3F2665|nr:helix-turn-helix domain-containing protein [Croceitalea sp. MTPC6]GMN17235.1 helix-turn-helix domain-containing protein [Croceitalea sp. MTPC9]